MILNFIVQYLFLCQNAFIKDKRVSNFSLPLALLSMINLFREKIMDNTQKILELLTNIDKNLKTIMVLVKSDTLRKITKKEDK